MQAKKRADPVGEEGEEMSPRRGWFEDLVRDAVKVEVNEMIGEVAAPAKREIAAAADEAVRAAATPLHRGAKRTGADLLGQSVDHVIGHLRRRDED